MVGWSRRNTESNRRRREWWNSLTPEEKEAALAHEQAFDRALVKGLALVVGGVILIAALAELFK